MRRLYFPLVQTFSYQQTRRCMVHMSYYKP